MLYTVALWEIGRRDESTPGPSADPTSSSIHGRHGHLLQKIVLDPVVSSALSFCSSHLHSRCHLPFCALETLASVRFHPSSSQHVVSSSCSILGITTCTALLILALAAYTLYLTGTLDYFTFSALSIATAVLHLVSVCVMWVPFFPCVYQELIALYLHCENCSD